MKLFANGCSFTWGGSIFPSMFDDRNRILDEHNETDLNCQRLKSTWPYYLSNNLGCNDFYNYALAAGSNARIVRKTIDFFMPLILSGQNLDEWLVVIQWTQPSRFEFYDEVSESWALCKAGLLLHEKLRPRTENERNLVQNRILLENDTTHNAQTLIHILCLGNFFKQHSIRYIFTSMSSSPVKCMSVTEIEYCNIQFSWHNNDMQTCGIQSMNYEQCKNSIHPSFLGHRQIATHLTKHIQNKMRL